MDNNGIFLPISFKADWKQLGSLKKMIKDSLSQAGEGFSFNWKVERERAKAGKAGRIIAKEWRKAFGENMRPDEAKQYLSDFMDGLKESGANELTAAKIGKAFSRGLRDTSDNASKASKVLGLFKKGVKGVGSFLGGAKNAMAGFGSTLKRTSSGLKLGLKNILAYAVGIKTLFSLVGKMKQFATEGFGNLLGASTKTKANMEELQASLLYLKNALGSAFSPIFNVIAPALSKLIDMLAAAANAVAKFMSALTGKEYLVAKKSFEGIRDDVSGAGGAMGRAAKDAKELKRQLMGFDQIQKLEDVTEDLGSGGSAGGSAGIDYGDMFTIAEADNATNKWAELVKKSWENADFTDIGKIVGDKIALSLDRIPWDNIKQKAGKIGSSLATLLNGVADSNFFPSLGTTISQAFNTALESAYTFVTEFDFKKFGTSIGSGINNAITNFDWKKAGFTTGEWVKGLFDLVSGALQETDWQELGTNVATFIKEIDWAGVISSAFGAVGSLAGAFAGFAKGLWDGLKQALNEYWDENFLNEEGELTIGSFLNGVWTAIKDIGTWIYDNVWVPFRDGFKKAFGINSPSKKFEEFGGDIIAGLKKGLANIWESVKGIFSGLVTEIGNFFKDPVGTIKVAVDKGVEKAKELWDGLKDSTVVKTLKEKGKNIIEEASTAWNAIKDGTALKTLKETGKSVIEKAKAAWDGIKSGDAVKTLFSSWTNNENKSNAEKFDALQSGKVKKEIEATLTKFDDVIPSAKKKLDMLGMINDVDETQDVKSGKKKGWAYATGWLDEVTEAQAVKSGKAKGWAYATGWINDVDETKSVQKGDTRGWAYITGWIDKVEKTANAKVKFKGSLGTTSKGGEITMELAKQGGIFSAGKTERIPQGSSTHGSLVWAGESGPEILGHFNGKTEILNRSQIAAAIASGVGGILRGFNPAPQLAFVDRQLAAQSALNAQQSQDMGSVIKLLSSLLTVVQSKDSDVYFDGTKVTNEVVKNINREIRATGVSPILY